MLNLSPTQIHLWQYPIGKTPAAELLEYARTLLSRPERQRCAAFYFENHRTEYALSHAILRLVLSEYAPVKPEDWRFSAGEWGKPEIAGPALDPPLWFNLSHTGGFVACVAGRIPQLGVDVENINRMTACDEIAKQSFAAAEYAYLRNLPSALQRKAFFRLWTLKEAYIKAEGKGLSIPLDSFCFRFSAENPVAGNQAEVTLELTGESKSDGWNFFEFHAGHDYRISIGAQKTGQGAFNVQCHDAAPLLGSTA
jgi:4'-phosphopantetheinyl transferase